MNPHFLQNVLTNAIYFTEIDPTKTEEILSRLSHLLRETFNATPQGWWALQSELDIIESYLDIQRIRFGERLEVNIHMEHGLSGLRIPCFLVQPLVENAVEHGFKQIRGVLTVSLHCRRQNDGLLCFEVINNGVPLQKSLEELLSLKHALGNIDKRLNLLFNRGIGYRFEEGRHHFSLEIPVDPHHESEASDSASAGAVRG